MQVSTAPSSGRGEPVLQPGYFTSSSYVVPLRADIVHLVETYTQILPVHDPFLQFKRLWSSQGWPLLMFKALDSRSRESFLNATLRLFLETTVGTEPLLTRIVGLFALYTFFFSQPSADSAPPLHAVNHIPIPCDQYTSLISLPGALENDSNPRLERVKPAVSHIVKTLVQLQVFYILPSLQNFAQNPRELPRELVIQEDVLGTKKKGRPSKRTKALKGKAAIDQLDSWIQKSTLNGPAGNLESPATPSLQQYQNLKSEMLAKLDGQGATDKILSANLAIVERLKQAEGMVVGDPSNVDPSNVERSNVERVERAALEPGGGILRLLDGAGQR